MGHDEVSRRMQDQAEREAVRTTIVGGRPPGSGTAVGAVPRGLEVLLKKASVDAAFRDDLLERRAEAAAALGLALTSGEKTMLRVVTRGQLARMITQTKVPAFAVPALLGSAAAVMLATLGLIQLTGCDEGVYSAGSRPAPATGPSTSQSQPASELRLPIAGERALPPTQPAVAPKQNDGPMIVDGIRPDVPARTPEGAEFKLEMAGLQALPASTAPALPPQPATFHGVRADIPVTVLGIIPSTATQPTTAPTQPAVAPRADEPPMMLVAGAMAVPRPQPVTQPATQTLPTSRPATQTQPGTATLLPGNTYTGETWVSAGILMRGTQPSRASQPATQTQPASQTQPTSQTQPVSVTKVGVAGLTLSGTNTYTAGMTVGAAPPVSTSQPATQTPPAALAPATGDTYSGRIIISAGILAIVPPPATTSQPATTTSQPATQTQPAATRAASSEPATTVRDIDMRPVRGLQPNDIP